MLVDGRDVRRRRGQDQIMTDLRAGVDSAGAAGRTEAMVAGLGAGIPAAAIGTATGEKRWNFEFWILDFELNR